jgi:hypothetical protein
VVKVAKKCPVVLTVELLLCTTCYLPNLCDFRGKISRRPPTLIGSKIRFGSIKNAELLKNCARMKENDNSQTSVRDPAR